MNMDNCMKYFGVTPKEILANYKSLKLTPDEMVLILGLLTYGDIFLVDLHIDKDYANHVLGLPVELLNRSEETTFSKNDIDTIKNRIIEIKRRGLWVD